MGKKRSFKIGGQIVDIPEAEVGQFLSDVPDAKEVQSFVIGKDTVDIPVAEVETFKADVPEAKPLFEQEPPEQGDTIPIPVVPTRNPLNPPQQDPEGPELPSVSMDEQGNMSRTVEMQRKQRDAILNSAFKVPEDIRSNPVFGKRYVMDVSRKTGIPENAVKQVYEQGERDYQEYNKLKADFDIGKGTDEDLNKMGGLLLNLGRYDEAIQAYKTLEGRLMQMGIKEYQPGMRQDYIDQRQAPAFIGILNAVYAKGDMKEYERLLKIADVKGLDFVKEYKQAIEESQNNGTPLDLRLSGLPSVGTGTSAQPGNEMTYDNSGQMVPVGTPEYRRTFENSKEADYINSIADAVGSLTGLPQTVEMTTHGAEKVGKSFQNQFGNPWKSKGVGETVSNYLGMLTGAVETVLAPAAFSTPVGAGVAVALPQLPPKVQEYLMPVSKIVRDAYDGKPPANAENLAILGDILTAAVLHVGATGVKEYVTSGGMGRDVVSAKLTSQLLLNKIKEIPPEQVREMVAEAEKRFEATGGDQKVYTELVRDRAQGAVDELKAIEHSAEPEPYNPEPAPESLRTVPEGADVEYEGKKGTLDRGDDGTWYFTDDEGKSTQIPVEDKYNPQEKLPELGIQVLPEVSKEAVARAVADAEQVGEVEYKGKRYFVSLDNPMKENPTGDLVFERTSDGRMLNRFDSHPDPTFAQNRKLAIVNKFLADKGLPPREGLIEPWKEAPVKEAPAPVSAEPVTEGAVTPEVAVGGGVPESKVTVDALADVESTPATTTETAPNVEDWSKDVASTAKALETKSEDDIDYISRKENNRRENSFYEKKKGVVFKGFGGNASVVSDKFGSKYKYFTNDPDYAKSFSLEKEYLTQKGNVEKYKTDYQKEYNTNEENYIKDVLKHSGKNKTTDLSPKDFDNYNDKLKADGYDVVKIKRVEPLIPSKSYKGHSSDLRSVEVEEHLILNDKSIVKISDQPSLVKNNSASISEAYHKAKADGSNPELVSAVEKILKPQEDASTQSTTVEVPRSETSRATSQVAEGSSEKLQKPAKEEKPLTIAQERKQKVYKAKTMTPVDFKQAVLRFALSPGGSIKLADAIHNTGYKTKDFPPFMMGKDGIPMHKVWEIMKGDEEISHLIPDDNHDFNNKFFEVITKYHSTKDMWADFLKNADTGEWETHGFPSQEAYERELMGRMEAASEGIEYDDIPKQLIEDVEREVDAMPDEAVEQMLKDLDENAPQEVYEETTNNGPEEVVAESETGSPKGEDLNEIAKEQQKRDADKAVEQELAKAKKDLEQAKTTLESKRKQVDERIAQEQQQEMFAEPKAENPLEGDFEAGARADALKAELNAYEAAQKKYAELRGKQKAEVMKKIDDFEQWVLNLPGIKDMSGGAEKAGIGAAEIVKGMAEAVRKAVEAGFDIADALHDAIEKYKKLSPEFFAAVSEKDIRDRFGVKEEAFAASNAASKKMREELGIPQDAEFTAQNRRDVEAVMAGAKNLKERSVNPKDLVDKVIWENHMLNAEEQQFLVQHEIDLFNERKGLEKKLDALLSKEVDPKQYMLKSVMPAADEFTTIQQRVNQIRSEQAQVLAALEKAGSEQSLVFRMRQLINRRDYSVENSIRTYMALFGREPSQRAKEFFAAKEREIAQIEEQRTALADKAKEAELQGIIDGLREELAREKARNEGKPVLTQKEIQRKKELKQKFAGVFNDVTNIAAALADKEFYEYAGIIFKETVGDVKNFTKRLIDELGPKVAPHAQEIFDRVKKSQYEEPEYRNNRLWIDPNMLREIVREGVENHTELAKRVHEIVEQKFPGIGLREVQDSISGYGKTINSKLPDIDRELNSLKRDMKLAVSLEDAKAGKGVKRSGYQPEPLTDSQREMMRTIREELKNYPQDEAAVEKKWKTALDKVKTGLRNAITDAEKRLEDLRAGRAVESRERKQIELDETALQMKEQLADLKKQLKDIEGEKVKTPEQIVREAVSALEKSEREYQDRINEIRTTGTYTPKVKRQVSGPAIDAARLARDLAKDEFERALETTDYPRQAAASKALSAAEAKLRALEDKIAAGDVSFRKRIMSLVDTENPLLKATKEQIKIKQDMIKAMREASGEADRHAVELWKARKQRRIDELNTKKANKDFTTKAQRELPIDEEMKRLAAAATRAKFEYDVAFELAKMENMSKVDKLKELGYDLYEFPKSIMASMDLSAVMRQGGILSARHPIQTITNTIPKMLKMFAKESFHKEWYDNLVHSDDYISAKESGLFLNEPNAKITAREEQAASRIAAAIPGVGASNRAYSGFLNMQRMQAFSDFKNACINAGVKGDMLRAELRNYADFINKATGRGSFGRLETSVPILNTLFFAPRFAISRFQLLRKALTGFYNTPKARIEAYKAMGSWAAAIGSTVALFKMAGYEVNTDMNSSDFLKVKRGNQTYDPWSGMQQPFVLLARTLMGSSKSVRGEEKELNKGGTTYKDVWERYLRSKAAPIPGMIYDAAKGKTMDNQPFKWIPESGEDITEGRGIASLIMPLIIQETIKEGKTDGIPTAVMNLLPNMVGIGVQTIYLNELKDKSKLEPDVRKLMDQSGFYPNQSNDTEVYVDDKPYEISADELTKIRELRLQKAGEIINRWYGKGKFDGLTKTEIHALFKKAYNRADGEAKDELLPEGWTNKKPKPEEEVFEVK